MKLTITAGAVTLADWRRIYRGATPVLDPSCGAKIIASAQAVARILAKHEPVYGDQHRLWQTRQREN
jgi:histidine ammonia-lyase